MRAAFEFVTIGGLHHIELARAAEWSCPGAYGTIHQHGWLPIYSFHDHLLELDHTKYVKREKKTNVEIIIL